MKTIALTGTEIAVTGLAGLNAAIRNDGADVIYAANQPGITPGADEVLSIPAGGAAVLHSIFGTVYLYGTGSVMMITSDYGDNPFDTSAQGGSRADEHARAAINEHAGDTGIHVTADEKSSWNGKTTISEAAQVFSNPNLLINPDFRINQRGKTGVISDAGYFIDRWQLVSGTAKITANGIVLNGTMKQVLEAPAGTNAYASASGGTASYDNTAKTFTLTAAGEKISWAKLEIGGIATPFSPPDPATELAKCQRYFEIITRGSDRNIPLFRDAAAEKYYADIQFKTTKANKPTLTVSGTPRVVINSAHVINAVPTTFAGSVDEYGGTILFEGITFDNVVSVNFDTAQGGYVAFEAEL